MSDFRPGETKASHRWSVAMYWPLTIAALVFLVTYTIHVTIDVQGVARLLTTSIIGATWLLFIVDYIARFSLADPKAKWFRSHLTSLAMVLVPALRPVRLLDASTRVAASKTSPGNSLRARLLTYGIGAALLLIWYVSLVVLEVERHAPGANILTFGDAVWWAFCTVTTVGYGDYAPVTGIGRFYAIILMAGGVVLVGLIVATISSWVVERAREVGPKPALPLPELHLRGHHHHHGQDAAVQPSSALPAAAADSATPQNPASESGEPPVG